MADTENGDDDDEFFGSELDLLPPNTLLELEDIALRSTQRPASPSRVKGPPSSNYGEDFEDDDLDDAVIIDEAKPQPLGKIILRPAHGVPSQNLHTLRGKVGVPASPNATAGSLNAGEGTTILSRSVVPLRETQQSQQPNLEPEASDVDEEDDEKDALRVQIQELLREREQFKQALDAKSGEVAIVRSKQEKAAKGFERELTALRTANAETLAKQQKALEDARRVGNLTATELAFAKRDLAEEAEKLRQLRRTKENIQPSKNDILATPKKDKASMFRDGFDDDEIRLVSPSKAHGRRSNNATPTKAAKRKRKGQESPAMSLELTHGQSALGEAQKPIVLDESFLERLRIQDDRLDFFESIMDHRIRRDHLRTFESFAQLFFPSDPKESFASIMIGSLPSVTSKQSSNEFAIEVCELIIRLWERCLKEIFYSPMYLIVDLLSFALQLKTSAIAPHIIDDLLPNAQATVDIVAVPRFQRTAVIEKEKDIHATTYLNLLHLVAMGCSHVEEHVVRFWRKMRLDFVLTILSYNQRLEDFDVMLQLLALSVTRDSIGPINTEGDVHRDTGRYMIDRISLLLVTVPAVPEGQETQDTMAISNLRLQILSTFQAFCQNSKGGAVLAKHSHAIGRLVKLMSDELDNLYSYSSGRRQSARIVCQTVRLLHHLVTVHESIVDMQEKLAVIHGGSQKYLLSLARLNVSVDDLVLGADIDQDVAECAHELLELAVTPEEGDTIYTAFSNTNDSA